MAIGWSRFHIGSCFQVVAETDAIREGPADEEQQA